MKWMAAVVCLLGLLAVAPCRAANRPFYVWSPPTAERSIWIDKEHQMLYAFEGSRLVMEAACSTAAHHEHFAPGDDRYEMPSTPLGSFHIFSKETDHYSKAYQVHMRYALFYDGGRAIHATYPNLYRYLGEPASGGCVRLTRGHASSLFHWAQNGDPVHIVWRLPGPVLALLHQNRPPVLLAKKPAPVITVALVHPEKRAVMTALQTPHRLIPPDRFDHEIVAVAGAMDIEPPDNAPAAALPGASASIQGAAAPSAPDAPGAPRAQ